MLIAQISDFHLWTGDRAQARADGRTGIYTQIDTLAAVRAGFAALARLDPAPDLILATGDLTANGRVRDYEALSHMFKALPFPVYCVPGNHDDRGAMRTVFGPSTPGAEASTFLNAAIDDHPIRLIGLDTTVPGEIGGLICAERAAWLHGKLAEAPERPTVIFMHHPPFDTGIGFMDRLALEGADRLAHVVSQHRQIVKIVAGHVHRHVETLWAGHAACTAPSLTFQMDLRLGHEQGSAWTQEPPGILLHLWMVDGPMTTHLSMVGDFGGARPFEPA